jgi:hypothetical protein
LKVKKNLLANSEYRILSARREKQFLKSHSSFHCKVNVTAVQSRWFLSFSPPFQV